MSARRNIWLGAALGALLGTLALAGCGSSASGAKGTVNVAYAGSLVTLMEHSVGPAFQRATGYTYQGKGAGSTALANQIKGKLIFPDVFISASEAAYAPLEGDANGNLARWHASFAATAMVVGYSPKSQFKRQLDAAASGATPWYMALRTPGLRLGRTDPALDPKGVNTILTMRLAEMYYQQPDLARAILGDDSNASQIFPEEDLVARLSSGQLDAGFFYLNEVKDAGLPYITLPKQINLSDASQSAYYARVSYTNAQGKAQTAKPILYSLTIPATVKDEAGAEAFIHYLLGAEGQRQLRSAGILAAPITLSGDASAVTTGLRDVIKGP